MSGCIYTDDGGISVEEWKRKKERMGGRRKIIMYFTFFCDVRLVFNSLWNILLSLLLLWNGNVRYRIHGVVPAQWDGWS